MSTRTTYCTVLARNYLPKALALAESLRRHHPEGILVALLVDVARDEDLPAVDGVRCVSTAALGLPERQVLTLAAGYDLVEFATAVKPLLLGALLDDAEQVVYLDPDTYVASPMVELSPALADSAGGILLTPHYLEPVRPGDPASEGHLLHVGVYNLGFCAVDRRAQAFLDWWWGHLRSECLHDPLSGLFVDQKWVDIGSTLFQGAALRHRGYNVGVGNLHERPLGVDADGYYVETSGDRLRLFHFHAFDTSAPAELSTRFDSSTAHLRDESKALDALCEEYAAVLRRYERSLPPAPPYPYATDTTGRGISRQLQRVYRAQSNGGEHRLPLPFVTEEAEEFAAWRRSARRHVARDLLGEAAKSVRCAFPDEYAKVKDRFPRLVRAVRHRYVRGNGIWG